MSSKRLPRANFSGIVSEDESPQAPRMANMQRTAAPHVQPKGNVDVFPNSGDSEGDRPTYQNYFFLAPNVRFTRTPDREIGKPRDDDGRVATPADEAAAPTAAAVAPAATVAKPAPAETPRSAARQAIAAARCIEPIRTVQ